MSLALVVVLMALVDTGGAGCTRTNWVESWKKKGTSMCNNKNDFISGFYRAAFTDAETDSIELIEGVECCSRNSPWTKSKTETMIANWRNSFNQERLNSWSSCPPGYFLNGFYRTKDADRGYLNNIEEGRCSKPADHPTSYSDCYKHDIRTCFANEGLCKCNDGYYVTGLHKWACNRLYCIRTLRCCKPASEPEVLDELYKVKTRIMDTTMEDIANFSDILGYYYCAGCRGTFVGEDFVREGDTWLSNLDQPCGWIKQRLNMAYGDWSFAMKDIKYGSPIIQNLVPETIDSGTFYNNDVTDAMKTIIRSESSIRTVTHTTTSSWRNNLELNIQVSYNPPGAGISVGYKFGYETSTSTKNEKNEKTSKNFTISTSKNIKAFSAAKWRFIVAKTRTSITYTATIIARFSTELQGLLRGGDGQHDTYTNYHSKYHGKNSGSNVNYKFGSSSVPFYTDLKQQSETGSHPWLWNDMRNARPELQHVVNELCDENRYAFQLTGRFDDVVGTSGNFAWEAVPLSKRSSDRYKRVPDRIFQNSTHVARALPTDVPPIKLDPP